MNEFIETIKTLKFRFAVVAVALFVVVITGGSASYNAMRNTTDTFSSYADANTPRTVALVELNAYLTNIRDDVDILVVSTTTMPVVMDRIFAELGRAEQVYRSYRTFGASSEQFTSILEEKEKFVYALLVFRKHFDGVDNSGFSREGYGEVVHAYDEFSQSIREAFSHETALQSDSARVLYANVNANTRTLSIIIIATVGLLLFSMVFAYFFLFKPLGLMRVTALSVARGDPDDVTPVLHDDEFGDVARAFNLMLQRMRSAKTESQERAEKLDTTLQELARIDKKTSEERTLYHELLTSIGDAVVICDATGQIILVNEEAETLIGLPIVGKNALKTLRFIKHSHNGEEARVDTRLVASSLKLKTPKVYLREYALMDARNISIPITLTIAPVIDDEGNLTHVVITFRDIRELVKVERARVASLHAMSHQLYTPLSSMRWFSEMFLDGSLGKLTQKQRDAIRNLEDNTLRMMELVNALLQISRVESKRIAINPEKIELAELAREVAVSLGKDASARKQTITVTSEESSELTADKEMIRQTIINLITNAIRYGYPSTAIKVHISTRGNVYVVSVENEGIGVPEHERDKIFQRFYRASNAQRVVPNGNGIGLSLVKLLVEDWGGEVGFDSIQDKSATFYFTIPKHAMKARKGEVSLKV